MHMGRETEKEREGAGGGGGEGREREREDVCAEENIQNGARAKPRTRSPGVGRLVCWPLHRHSGSLTMTFCHSPSPIINCEMK